MKKNIVGLLSALILTPVLCYLLLVVNFHHFIFPIYTTQYYKFDTQSEFHSKQNGDLPILQRISEKQFNDQKQIDLTGEGWTDEEFQLIQRNILKQLHLMDDLKLVNVFYSLPCMNIEEGATYGIYTLSNFSEQKESPRRLKLTIIISRKSQTVIVKQKWYYPVYLYGESVFGLDSLNLNFQEAIKIVDKNGGKQKREGFKNNCEISVGYSQDSSNKIWSVHYTATDYGVTEFVDRYFWVDIDDNTEKIIED